MCERWYWRKNKHNIICKMRFLPDYCCVIIELTMLQEKYANDMDLKYKEYDYGKELYLFILQL